MFVHVILSLCISIVCCVVDFFAWLVSVGFVPIRRFFVGFVLYNFKLIYIMLQGRTNILYALHCTRCVDVCMGARDPKRVTSGCGERERESVYAGALLQTTLQCNYSDRSNNDNNNNARNLSDNNRDQRLK